MGGPGSGQTGWKTKAEHCLSIDVRRWAREGRLVPDSYFLAFSNGGNTGGIGVLVGKGHLFLGYSYHGAELQGYRVTLAWTDCHFGGSRVWFRCSRCDGRVAKLFLDEGHFACRVCHRLAYLSQSDDQFGAFHRQIGKIKQKLGGEDDLLASKGMQQRTYERLRKELIETELQLYQVILPSGLKLLKRLGKGLHVPTAARSRNRR
jgi:hypothetical protein